MSRKELAKLIGVHVTSVHKWERGERTPSLRSLERITGALGSTMTAFWREAA